MTTTSDQLEGLGSYKFGWSDSDVAGAAATRGVNEAVVRDISAKKSEPDWMLDLRLKGLKLFGKKPMPTWGSDLSGIDFDNIKYFVRRSAGASPARVDGVVPPRSAWATSPGPGSVKSSTPRGRRRQDRHRPARCCRRRPRRRRPAPAGR